MAAERRSRPRSCRAPRPWSSTSTRREPERGQEAADEHGGSRSRKVTGDRRRRAATRDDPDDARAELDPDLALLGRFGKARAVARHRSPDPRRRRADRRAGHLRSARSTRARWRRSRRAGAAGRVSSGTAAPGPAAAGPATAGAATPGRAVKWSGNSWCGNSLVGGQVVRQQLERQLLVGQQLVDGELGLAATRQVQRGLVLALHSGHDARAVHWQPGRYGSGSPGPSAAGSRPWRDGWGSGRASWSSMPTWWRGRSSNPGSRRSTRSSRGSGPNCSAPTGRWTARRSVEMVFADPAALRDLEAIVHPAVRPRILAAMDGAAADGAEAVVVEAIRLVEGGLAALCDEVWLVECDPAIQRARLIGRGSTADDADQRIEAQAGLTDRVAPAATRIIDTSGSEAATRALVEDALESALRPVVGSSRGLMPTGRRRGPVRCFARRATSSVRFAPPRRVCRCDHPHGDRRLDRHRLRARLRGALVRRVPFRARVDERLDGRGGPRAGGVHPPLEPSGEARLGAAGPAVAAGDDATPRDRPVPPASTPAPAGPSAGHARTQGLQARWLDVCAAMAHLSTLERTAW